MNNLNDFTWFRVNVRFQLSNVRDEPRESSRQDTSTQEFAGPPDFSRLHMLATVAAFARRIDSLSPHRREASPYFIPTASTLRRVSTFREPTPLTVSTSLSGSLALTESTPPTVLTPLTSSPLGLSTLSRTSPASLRTGERVNPQEQTSGPSTAQDKADSAMDQAGHDHPVLSQADGGRPTVRSQGTQSAPQSRREGRADERTASRADRERGWNVRPARSGGQQEEDWQV